MPQTKTSAYPPNPQQLLPYGMLQAGRTKNAGSIGLGLMAWSKQRAYKATDALVVLQNKYTLYILIQ
ncbi:MAG: hypothetical protein IPN94_04960 [Sphingobacteriales bacterium]|nr:hypothetical protein [Sphingobacteriales bacterium]